MLLKILTQRKGTHTVLLRNLYRKLGTRAWHRIRRQKRRASRAEGAERLLARPFELGDLRPVTEGYRIGPPDFVGIGCAKAGTSWWYQLLLDHPQIVPNRLGRKELCYFYHFGYQGIGSPAIETYRQAFAAPEGCICGEWSTVYFGYPLAIHYLAQAAPDAKLLAIVRNPVDRVPSAMNQLRSRRVPWMGLKGRRAYIYTGSLFVGAIAHSLLYEPFRRLLKVFDRAQLLILQYEQCKEDPALQIARTYRFLGLDDSHVPANLARKVNVQPYIVPRPGPDERVLLADHFYDDVHAFAELFPEIDLTLWPDFLDH